MTTTSSEVGRPLCGAPSAAPAFFRRWLTAALALSAMGIAHAATTMHAARIDKTRMCVPCNTVVPPSCAATKPPPQCVNGNRAPPPYAGGLRAFPL